MASVLLLSFDAIGSRMAGTGIRYWNLARLLAREHRVTLAAPFPVDLPAPDGVDIVSYADTPGSIESIRDWQAELIEGHEIVIGQDLPYYETDAEFLLSRRLVVDLYSPAILEKLEDARRDPEVAEPKRADDVRSLNRLLSLGDFFICASERQRDLWLGALATAGRLSLGHAQADAELRSLIDVVPFGLPHEPPAKSGCGPRGTIPGVEPEDVVLLWNGGIWNWLDPDTAIRAVGRLAEEIPTLRLVFMGARSTMHEAVSGNAVRSARSASDELGLTDRHVFFHDWVPYEERQNWLLEADAAISLHVPTAEARYAFRTRMLDLLWCRVPVVATEGDVLAELVVDEGIGRAVAAGDVEGTATAIRQVIDPATRVEMQSNLERVARGYTWETVAEPLLRYCRTPAAPDPTRGSDPIQTYIHHLERTYRDTVSYSRRLESVIQEQQAAIESGWCHRLRRGIDRLAQLMRVR